jgi:uncharacterized protein YpmS
MRRLFIRLVVSLLLIAALAIFVLYHAVQQVPPFYRELLQTDTAAQEAGSDAMLQRIAALASNVNRKKPHWRVVFTQQQINGWFAADMLRNHPDALPSSMKEPRVAIHRDEMTIACGYHSKFLDTVLSLTVDASLLKPGKIALRFRSARAGAAPLPLSSVLGEISQAARSLKWKIEWQQADGDPVAILTIPNQGDEAVALETLRLVEGEIQIAGSTQSE